MNDALFVDSLVAVNLVTSVFLWSFLNLWLIRSNDSHLHKRQTILFVNVFFPAMITISLSHASWGFAHGYLALMELLFTLICGPLFFDMIYGRLQDASLLPRSLLLVCIAGPGLLLLDPRATMLVPAFFTLASAVTLLGRAKHRKIDRLCLHAVGVAMVFHIAQLIRFLGRDFDWIDELVPFTTTILGLVYITWFFLPRTKRLQPRHQGEETDAIFQLVDNHLRQSEAYRDPELTLTKLAQALELPAYLISRSVNMNAGRFTDYINEYRVQAFLDRYRQGMNIEAVAYDTGFNSRSAFYRAIKARTGKTPSQLATSS